MVGQKFCAACGVQSIQSAAICVSCGTAFPAVAPMVPAVPYGTPYYPAVPYWAPKDKSTAVLLAVFLSFWTWCYTYRANAGKFWAGLALCFTGGLLSFFILPALAIPAVWIWAIVDAAATPQSFYRTGVR